MTYQHTPETAQALAWLRLPAVGAARAVLLEGPPGAGKSAFAAELARQLGAPLIVAQLHAWSDDQELFVGVDVVAAVAGDAASVRQPGVLARAAEAAEHGPAVLLLDEVDKCQERTEVLLLDWLQSGRVPVRPGVHLTTRMDNLRIVLTSNAERELSDALLRRVRRVRVTHLPAMQVDALAAERASVPRAVAVAAGKAARKALDGPIDPQRLTELCREVWHLAKSAEDCARAAQAWTGADKAPDCAHLWGEVSAARRKVA